MSAPSLRRLDGGPDTASDDPLRAYLDPRRPPHDDRPYLLVNFVSTIDGSVTVDGRVGSLSSPLDKQVFRLLRAVGDAVLVGAGTARVEGYGPIRLDDLGRQVRAGRDAPAVAVVTRTLDLPWDRPLFQTPEIPTIVITSGSAPADRLERAHAHADVIVAGDTEVELADALAQLRSRGMHVVTCEGGPMLFRDLLTAGLVDELCLTIAPFLGGDPVRLVADAPGLAQQRLELAHVLRGGDELFLRYLVHRGM